MIDASGIEGREPIDDFRVLQNELRAYKPELLEKPSLIVLNKIDMEGAKEHAEVFHREVPSAKIFEISALEELGLDPLLEAIRGLIKPVSV